MSRIGKKPVALPGGVKVELKDRTIKVSGPKGNLTWTHAQGVKVEVDPGAKQIKVTREREDREARALHGTTRAIINNMVKGAAEGYSTRMEIYGTGYGCKVQGSQFVLTVGYAHTVDLNIPAGIKVDIEVPQTKGNEVPAKFSVSGPDKQVVGQFCRAIKDARPPEPYQGKGIRYAGEQIRRKAGKAFAGAGGGA